MEETRLCTGVPGLDEVLSGGPFAGSNVLVLGDAGTGKTILGGQVASRHVAQGGRAVFVTLLSESTERLVRHLSTLRFFDPDAVSRELYVVSGHLEFERGGFEAALALIRRTVRVHNASLLVVDGLSLARDLGPTTGNFARFFYDLAALSALSGCTCLLLANPGSKEVGGMSESALADLVLELRNAPRQLRNVRSLRVVKFRGSEHLRGAHTFDIRPEGIAVYPRLDARVARAARVPSGALGLQSFGVPGLDAMLCGGLPEASTTALLGAPGSGKTLLGLTFLAHGARQGEATWYYGFYESPARLVAKADTLGLDLTALTEGGALRVTWHQPVELLLDEVAEEILREVERARPRRLFLDGVDALLGGAEQPERVPRFITALSLALRARGVAFVFSEDTGAFEPQIRLSEHGASASADNILLLRHVELHARLLRMLSVLKLRHGDFDVSLRELLIRPGGIDVGDRLEGAERLMSGQPTWQPGDERSFKEHDGEAHPR